MIPGPDALEAGLRWLAEGGRDHARMFADRVDDNGELCADLEEAVAWLNSINESKEI